MDNSHATKAAAIDLAERYLGARGPARAEVMVSSCHGGGGGTTSVALGCEETAGRRGPAAQVEPASLVAD
jgi:hypothetical protein